jgi:serine/threonine protein kinase
MNDEGYCHRDIKLENLLLDSDFNLKLSDFGFSSILMKDNQLLMTMKGTLGYMAPEIFQGKGYHGELTDIFALGVVLFGMIFG